MKSKLTILMITAIFVAMIFSTGCKKSFDITGTWALIYNWPATSNTNSIVNAMHGAAASGSGMIIFTGDKKSGTFLIPADEYTDEYTGIYTVDSDNVSWVYDSGTTYIGAFSDNNTMTGTMTSNIDGFVLSGTWSAIR